ncbi:hypothetical protein D0T49_03480 [Paludibacter sp. 221]|nr:hypothetical protein [Paludibacter sp. 221]
MKINCSHFEVIKRTEITRKPTAKRVYKTKFNYKVKFIAGGIGITNIIYDINNKLCLYVIDNYDEYNIAVTIKPTSKKKLSPMTSFIRNRTAHIL